ncbi:SCA7, zinc-binding domain-containing protein [Immersiella caudata]|uniref:SCA7, zinc-binding domain-containing protein n=1 Tax=Immersiella caudata TaxID=314043 RepID=A0AA39WWZ7_9PEZI|nr:SCA7, zinc-binding domain-containing protein [Immersiella caudata]
MATMESRKDEESTTIKVASAKNPSKVPINGTLKLKKGAPKVNKPGAWKEAAALDAEEKKKTSKDKDGSIIAASSPSPVINNLEEKHHETFISGRPLDDVPDLQQCKHCRKGVIGNAAKDHIATCLRIKKEKAQRKKEAREARERAKEAAREEEARKADADGDGRGEDDSDADDDVERKGPNAGKTTKKAAGKKTDSAVGGKKRKAEGELDKGKAKKKKDEPKPKAAKPKGPVDVERQCGVTLPNGQPCARSLTCKSHSMGAKRSVPGRSLPYDMLLAAYQKKNQAKQQKAAIDANAPLEEEDDINAGNVDSDEETAAVMSALARWNPQPVVPQPVFEPIKSKYSSARFYEQMMAATNGGRINIFKVVGFGAQRMPENHTDALFDAEDAPGEPDPASIGPFARRPSSNFSLSGPPPPRRPSLHGSSSPIGPAAEDDEVFVTEPDNGTDEIFELKTSPTEPTDVSKKRLMAEVDGVSEHKQPKQPKRRKTEATADTLDKPKQKTTRRKKAEIAAGNQAESALVATARPSTFMPAPRRKKADAPAPKQTEPSPLPTSKPTPKIAARPIIFAVPLGSKQSQPSHILCRGGEPIALDKCSTSKESTILSKKRSHDTQPSPNEGDVEIHAKRALFTQC